jgi:hypothetical protein
MGTPIEGGEVQGTEDAPGLNPAWDSVLSQLPEEFHPLVTPEFQKWDQAAQKRIEDVNSQLAQFEPYKPFIESGIQSEHLEQGLQFLHQLNTNPQAVYEALKEAYGYDSSVDAEEEDDSEPEVFQDPRFDQLQQGVELVAQTILQQQQEKLNEQASRELDRELTELREKHGDFDERYVLSLAAVNEGLTLEQAVQSYQQMAQNILQTNPRPFAPTVMGNSSGGTGLPSQAIDPRKLDGKETRSLVEQILRAANTET